MMGEGVAPGSEDLQIGFHEEFRAGSHAAEVLGRVPGRVLNNDLALVLASPTKLI